MCACKVEYVGGDNPASHLKIAADSKEAIAFKDALIELVKDISVMHFMGKKPEDFAEKISKENP